MPLMENAHLFIAIIPWHASANACLTISIIKKRANASTIDRSGNAGVEASTFFRLWKSHTENQHAVWQ